MDSEDGILAALGGLGCLGVILVVIVNIGFWVVVIWAIIQVVQYVTV